MMTVIFPTGLCVQYNTATWVLRREEYSDLYTKKDGDWIAQVPNTALIESVRNCRIYRGGDAEKDMEIRQLRARVERLQRKVQRLKKGPAA